jgi:hypothetical protein
VGFDVKTIPLARWKAVVSFEVVSSVSRFFESAGIGSPCKMVAQLGTQQLLNARRSEVASKL